MNLLVINQYASTPEYSTGAGERFFHLSKYFSAQDWNVTVISGAYNHLFYKYPQADKLFNEEVTDYSTYIWVRLRKYKKDNLPGRLFSWIEFLTKLFFYKPANRPDIIIVSSMSIFPILYSFFLRRKYRCKVVLEVRDIWPLTPMLLGGYSKNHPFIWLMSKLELFAYNRSDQLVSVLPDFDKYVHETLNLKDKIVHWIPNGISVEGYTNKEDVNIAEVTRISNREFTIIYAGALGIANAMAPVIEAFRHLGNEYKLVVLGDGPERRSLEALSASLPNNNVIFLGKVLKKEVYSYIRESDACLISWRDSELYKYGVSANKYNDYMMARKPIISASNILSDPVVIASCGVQCSPEDPIAISKAIVELSMMDDDQLKLFGNNGYEYFVKNQTYEVLSTKYLHLLNSVIER